jgi:hypothetical protein
VPTEKGFDANKICERNIGFGGRRRKGTYGCWDECEVGEVESVEIVV